MTEYEQERGYWRALYAAAHDLTSTLEPSAVLARLARSAVEALGAKACTLRLLEADGHTLSASASYGLSDGYLRKGSVDVSHSSVDREALSGRTVRLSDVRTDPRFQYPEQAAREGLVSLLCVPLMAHGQAIGILRIYTGAPKSFSPEEVEFLEAIASLGAIAVENARLYERLEQDLNTTLDVLWGEPTEEVAAAQ